VINPHNAPQAAYRPRATPYRRENGWWYRP
jgi:hypothetical protein